MKVNIDRDQDGWFYAEAETHTKMRGNLATYDDAKRAVVEDGHELRNGGWIHRLLSWNWHNHSFDGFPGWEIERDGMPAFVRLTHTRGPSDVESHVLAVQWDYIAEVDFYQRDKTDDNIPFVVEGGQYWSLWWFATIAERDRFLRWHAGGR